MNKIILHKFNNENNPALRIALIYAGFSVLWILFSDRVLLGFIQNAEILTNIQMVKGWFFVLATALIIYFLLRKEIYKYEQTEVLLRESEEQYRELVENAAVGFFQATKRGRLLMANQRMAETLGYKTVDDLIGSLENVSDFFINPEEREKILKILGKKGYFEKKKVGLKRKDKKRIWVNIYIKKKKNNKGINICEGILEDVTRQFQHEQILAARIMLNEYSTTHSLDELLKRTLDEVENFTGSSISFFHFIERDQGTVKLQNWSSNTLNTMCSAEGHGMHYPLSKAGVWVECVRKQCTVIHNDYRSLPHRKGMPEGHAQIVRELVVPVFREGKIVAVLGVGNKEWEYDEDDARTVESIADITWDIVQKKQAEAEKKGLKDQLRQTQRMEAIGKLAGGIAHDFNNLLSPILIHSEMAMMDLPSDSPLQFNMKQILDSGKRARDLVKQILTFGRKDETKSAKIRVTPIIKETIKMIRSTTPTTIEIIENIETENDVIYCDPSQIQQIVLNLCTNAVHAMKEHGGTLKVSMEKMEADLSSEPYFKNLKQGTYIRLRVEDTGCGIDEKIIKNIFEPYFTTKEVGEGSGLGLAVVHGIVKELGGDIQVQSEIGKGSIFDVFLPRVESESSEKEAEKTGLKKGSEKILFVDDEAVAVKAHRKMLEILGYNVASVTKSEEALEKFLDNPSEIDLVITDMTMPEMTGKELARKLISVRPDIPIIICTGYSDQIDEKMADELGVKALIMKPITIQEFADKIREVLDEN